MGEEITIEKNLPLLNVDGLYSMLIAVNSLSLPL
jgi:hypothetical protein